MSLKDPKFIYVQAAESVKPGYLHARMELYRQKVAEEQRLRALAAKRAARRAKAQANVT